MTRWFLHVDLDQFLAAVEVRRRPELGGRPLVVGGNGDPTRPRQVVATASYEARAFGVRSGMPLRTALRRCPDAVFLPSDKPAYEQASAEVIDTLRRFPAVVEVWGWDEAVVGADADDPEALARSYQRAVLADTGLRCSIGIGDNKLRAKTATAFAKPAGRYRLTADNWLDVMGDRATDRAVGCRAEDGAQAQRVGHRHRSSAGGRRLEPLRARFGPTMGPWYVMLGRGVGSTTISDEPWVRRGLSHQTTFPHDLHGRAETRNGVAGARRPRHR